MAVYVATEGGGFRLATTLSARAAMGRLVAPLAAGPQGLFDRGNAIEVELFGGALASLPDIDVFAGGNAAAVMTAGGSWEVLQFAEAELVGTNTYRLTRLLRGQSGSEQAMATGAAVGADFVLLDGAIMPLPVRADQLGLPLRYRIGPARDDYAAPSFVELTVTAEGIGLIPFAPTDLKAHRDVASGDIALSWIRRTRFGGTAWELVEVPLNEESEAYRVEILAGDDILRTLATSAPTTIYAASDQIADFGAPAASFHASRGRAQRDGRAGPQTPGNRQCLTRLCSHCRSSLPSRRRSMSPTMRRSRRSTRSSRFPSRIATLRRRREVRATPTAISSPRARPTNGRATTARSPPGRTAPGLSTRRKSVGAHGVEDEYILLVFTGSGWADFVSLVLALQNLTLLGIGTTADAMNPFSAKLNKALWTAKYAAEGGDGDLRYTLNKETAADVLSLLLQTDFSGRAEIGLVGDDDTLFKVSPDGSTWFEAIRIDKDSGYVGIGGVSSPAASVHAKAADGSYLLRLDSGAGSSMLRFYKSGTILVGDIGQDLWFNLSGSHNVYFNGGQGILATSARILPTASDMAAGAGGLQIGTSAYATASYQLTAPFAFYKSWAWNGSNGYSLTSTGWTGLEQVSATAGDARFFWKIAGSYATAAKMTLDKDGNLAAVGGITASASIRPGSYTVATVPSASALGAGATIYVSDRVGRRDDRIFRRGRLAPRQRPRRDQLEP